MMRAIAKILVFLGTMSLVCAYGENAIESNRVVVWGDNSLSSAGIRGEGPTHPLLPEGKISNLVDVSSSGSTLALVAGDHAHNPFDGLSLFTYNLSDGVLTFAMQEKGLVQASISPKGDLAALIVCGGNGCDLKILNMQSGHTEILVPDVIQRFGGLSWNSSGSLLAYTTSGNQVKVRDLSSGKDILSLSGSQPALSPSGNQLAYVREKSLLIYNLSSATERVLVKRHFWQSSYQGSIYWSSDGSKLLINVSSGFAGYEFKCLIADPATEKFDIYDFGFGRCGPWL